MSKKYKVAVYGSLRKGLHNYEALKLNEEKYLGEFESKPIFSLYDLGSFPGLKIKNGTSVKFEVYEVFKEKFEEINRLEGYSESGGTNNLYDRKSIVTPYGEAYFYEYNGVVNPSKLVECGDWKDHYDRKVILEKIS